MADENTERVRQIVREELARSETNPVRISPQNIYSRTQQLIRGAARSAVTELSRPARQGVEGDFGQPGRRMPSSAELSSPRVLPPQAGPTTPKRKTQPGHPWRLKPAKAAKKKQVPGKSVYVWLLDFVSKGECGNEYILEDEMVLLKGFVTLSQEDKTCEIKENITSLFKTKFPLISSNQYDYVKRERNKICTPMTGPNFTWNFTALKTLWGQGKLYCRLNVPYSYITAIDSDSDGDLPSPLGGPSTSGGSTLQEAKNSASKSKQESCGVNISSEDQGCSSVSINCHEEQQPSSATVPLEEIPCCSTSEGTSTQITELQNLVHELLDKQEKKEPTRFDSLESALTYLKGKLGNVRERLRVEQEYALEEAFAYHKSSDFQPEAKLAVQYKGQAAVDTGGVLRQFFSDVLRQMVSGGTDLPPLFEGSEIRKLPVHNAGTVLSGVLELVGKIIAHSIVHAGIGLCCLAPAVFKFLATGELTEAIACLSVEDAVSPVLKYYIEMVFQSDISNNCSLQNIYAEDEFQQLLCESGVTQILTINTRESIMQSLIYHDVIGKRIVALEQIRKGMKLLGVLDVIALNSDLFEPLFVYSEQQLTYGLVLSKLTFPELNEENQVTHQYLLQFLQEADRKKLEQFLTFCTGCKILPMQKINVMFANDAGVFASTCTFHLTLPVGFTTYSDFVASVDCVLSDSGKAFTSV